MFQKTDMYRWRELIDIYLQAGVFFSTHELDHGIRTHTAAAKQLQWFQNEVTRRGLLDLFKLPASRPAFNRFIAINVTLLMNLKFQEINKTAITKILKSKFSPLPLKQSLGSADRLQNSTSGPSWGWETRSQK